MTIDDVINIFDDVNNFEIFWLKIKCTKFHDEQNRIYSAFLTARQHPPPLHRLSEVKKSSSGVGLKRNAFCIDR